MKNVDFSPKPKAIALLLSGLMASSIPVYAQQGDKSIPLEELVVIGTAGGKGISRDDASFAVTTFDSNQLEKIQAKSTADLLKSVPGIWSESSGGVAGANIDVRGLPGGGDAPFAAFSVNGSPLFGFNSLSFLEGSTLFRIDETVASVEALRGGPNAVFAKGEPGATINFKLKEGGEETLGRVKYSTSDYDLQRFDGHLSGEIAEDLYYSIGGYVSTSPGIRDAQFQSEEGQQFSAQITKLFENGKVNVYTRITDDHGQWYLPISLNNPNIDVGTFSQLGNATRLREIQVSPTGETEVFDFSQGRGWDGQVSGANIEFDLGNGYTFKDNVNFLSGDANTFGLVPSGSATTVNALSNVIGGPVTTLDGRTLGGNELVQTYGHWIVLKDLESFSNDLSISKTFGSHDLTVGLYQSTFSSNDWWSLGNPVALENNTNGDFLNASITPSDIAAAGGDAGFMFGLASSGDAQVSAIYAADSWQVNDRLRVDLGIRFEDIEIDYTLDTGPGFADGVRDMATSIDGDETAYTAAVDYRVSDELGVFVRISDGFTFPTFDDIRGGSQNVRSVEQFEAGIKYSNQWLSAYATVYSNEVDAFSNVVGSAVANAEFVTQATGIEIEGTANFGSNFSTTVSATFQNAEIEASSTASNIGNTVLRQPDSQIRISPEYAFSLGTDFSATLYASAAIIGDRYGDNGNTVDLPSFEKFDLGLILRKESGLFFQVHGDNLSDSEGITEGDPRNPAAPNGRPILGRSVKFSIGYDF
ncbi:MAG: outer membrane receptor protein involved in Fe transport [Arenicella sp.]|jgi:outer membrane receptor protein involved in Fe transport